MSDAKSQPGFISLEGALFWAFSDPVSHTCQFSRLAGPLCLQLAAYRVVTAAVNVNLKLIFMFANFRGAMTTVGEDRYASKTSPKLNYFAEKSPPLSWEVIWRAWKNYEAKWTI